MNPAVSSLWPSVRILGWVGGVMAAAGVWGLEWLSQPVTVPLAGLLILTFVPTADMIHIARTQLDRFKRPKDNPKNGGKNP
jgi:hypothetical protein